MDYKHLRSVQNTELAAFLRQARDDLGEEVVSSQLLGWIQIEAVPPTTWMVWLVIADNPRLIDRSLDVDIQSLRVRHSAIKYFGRSLRTSRWKEAWSTVGFSVGGGVAGLLWRMSQMSVVEVHMILNFIQRSSTSGPDLNQKRKNITELFKSLNYHLFLAEREELRSKCSPIPLDCDGRNLQSHYLRLFPSCSEELVEEVITHRPDITRLLGSYQNDARLLLNHHKLLFKLVKKKIFDRLEVHSWQCFLKDVTSILTDGTSPIEGFTMAMYNSIELLGELVRRKAQLPGDSAMSVTSLVEQLVSKIVRKRLCEHHLHRVIDLYQVYLDIDSKTVERLTCQRHSLLYHLIEVWGRNDGVDTARLRGLLRRVPKRILNIGDCQALMSAVKPRRRYELLTIYFHEVLKLDLRSEKDLKTVLEACDLPITLFLALDIESARALLVRIQNIRPAIRLVKDNDGSIFTHGIPIDTKGRLMNVDFLEIHLHHHVQPSQALLEAISEATDERRKKAEKAREQAERASFAEAALLYAVAAGSVTVYGKTLLWARRFLRDPLTVPIVFSMRNSAALLSGIPQDHQGELCLVGMYAEALRLQIREANEIMLSTLRTACLAMREPSFNPRDWNMVLTVFYRVCHDRKRHEQAVKSALRLDDAGIYDVFWVDTLATLINAEEIGLAPEHTPLKFDTLGGPLLHGSHGYSSFGAVTSASFARFIDDLAQHRDALWQKYRPTQFPAVVSLPPPWPRGLPIQALFSVSNNCLPPPSDHIPFISRKAKAILFSAPAVVMQPFDLAPDTSNELRLAIGRFVDSYTNALRLFIFGSARHDEQKARFQHVWDHATTNFIRVAADPGNLTEQEITVQRNIDRWSVFFRAHLPARIWTAVVPRGEAMPAYPLLPSDAAVDETTEWNPEQDRPASVPEIRSKRLVLDCILHTGGNSVGERIHSHAYSSETVFAGAYYADVFWHNSNGHPKDEAIREAQIVAAMLVADSWRTGPPRLLSSPFPSHMTTRLPPLYLDEDFLSKIEKWKGHGTLNPLHSKRNIEITPPTLLGQLVRSYLKFYQSLNPDDKQYGRVQTVTFSLLSSFAACDRPQFAMEDAAKAILDNPDASSWHRIVLSIGVFKRLRRQDLQDLLNHLKVGILAKLEDMEQAQRGEKIPQEPSIARSQPIIKISTIKYFAQLLNDADYVSAEEAIELLGGLLTKAKHVDIRAAVIDALFSTLRQCDTETKHELGEKVLLKLSLLVPIAVSGDERKALTEQDWVSIRETGALLEIDRPEHNQLGPLTSALVSRFASLSKFWQDRMLKVILLPMFEQSVANHQRWIRAFIEKIDLDPGLLVAIPPVPFKVALLETLIREAWALLDDSYLALYSQWEMYRMNRPQMVIRARRQVSENPALAKSNAGQHFRTMTQQASPPPHGGLIQKVFTKWSMSPEKLETRKKLVLQHALTQVKAVIDHPKNASMTEFKQLVTDRAQNGVTTDLARRFLIHVMRYISSIRTPEWQADPDRKPPVLPDTFALDLHFLSNPYDESEPPTFPSRLLILARELIDMTCFILGKPFPQRYLIAILGQAKERLQKQDVAHMGWLIGTTGRAKVLTIEASGSSIMAAYGPSTPGSEKGGAELRDLWPEDLICIQLAENLLRDAPMPRDETDVQNVRNLVESWVHSPDEDVRMLGWGLVIHWARDAKRQRSFAMALKGQGDKKWALMRSNHFELAWDR